MWRLEKEFRFEASHQLVHHDGKCARLHGHSWRGTLVCQGTVLVPSGPKKNMLVDYTDIGRAGKLLEEALDHRHLNEVLGIDMPTSEYLAQWCLDHVQMLMPNIPLVAVRISETCTSACEYRP